MHTRTGPQKFLLGMVILICLAAVFTQPGKTMANTETPFTLHVTIEKTSYKPGEDINAELRITNSSGKPVAIDYMRFAVWQGLQDSAG